LNRGAMEEKEWQEFAIWLHELKMGRAK